MTRPEPPMPPARAHVFIATSADGFIAREDGSIDWLLAAQQGTPEGEDFGYAAFTAGLLVNPTKSRLS
mgnify:CR=1 FL=1